MKTQLKFVVDSGLAEEFKQAVLRRRGKLDLSREGEQALRLYIQEGRPQLSASKSDPLLSIIGLANSKGGRVNALEDERRLYGSP